MSRTEINLVEASIEDLQTALSSGAVTSVDLVARYLRRISAYDCHGSSVALNSIPILNEAVFDEAAQSDNHRAEARNVRPLEGIPWTVKDSFKVNGMPVAAASPAFEHLQANEDAFLVKTIREAGGVLMGRTNMPSMACGGMARGIRGRAENPYNPKYLAAAFVSGSSNGSAVSTAASFAAFGLGAETVSSGRSPASNNALIAYTPSRHFLSVRGNWPLYPTCDVPVPHTRTTKDLFTLLDVVSAEDPIREGDFWREQNFLSLPERWHDRPKSFTELSATKSLAGLRIAVPDMFIGGPAPRGARPVETNPAVVELWQQARKDLEALGAEIILVSDFPAMTAYENEDLLPANCPRLPPDWNTVERSALIATSWDGFLKSCDDPGIPDLLAVDPAAIYPDSLRTDPERAHFDQRNAIQYHALVAAAQAYSSSLSVPGLADAVVALEGMRKHLLEDWLTALGCDCVAFPAAGDVGPADADKSFEGMAQAWRNGVYYSNGNRAMRHLGIPSVSVPMGLMRDKGVPVNLTFAGRGYDDVNLLRWAHAFEAGTKRRVAPLRTPPLETDVIRLDGAGAVARAARSALTVRRAEVVAGGDPHTIEVVLYGRVTVGAGSGEVPILEVTVDGTDIPMEDLHLEEPIETDDDQTIFSFSIKSTAKKPVVREGLDRTLAPVARDKTMVVILARATATGRPSGWLGLL